jgi:aspartate/methionine/tyrosine aminotransferase
MIILNFPNNPTGMTLNHNEIREICEIAKKYDAFILSDEVYKELNFETNFNYLSPFDCYDKAIVINSMSKAFGIAGARIGWLIASQEVIKKMYQSKTLCFIMQ